MALQKRRLYPPYVEGTIPAFTGSDLTIPFSMNEIVNINEVKCMQLKIKGATGNNNICDLQSDIIEKVNDYYTVTFDVSEYLSPVSDGTGDPTKELIMGFFYKCQLAYVSLDGDIGYFSTVGVVKYTSDPDVQIVDLDKKKLNVARYEYLGTYSQAETTTNASDRDTTEKEYSYIFKLYDKDGKEIETSEQQIHDASNDVVSYESSDPYMFSTYMELEEPYFVNYTTTSRNEVVTSSPKYRIMDVNTMDPDLDAYLHADMDYENGCVVLTLLSKSEPEKPTNGLFRIERVCEGIWVPVHLFSLTGKSLSKWEFRDFTVEHGKEYTYCIRQYSPTTKLLSNKIMQTRTDEYTAKEVPCSIYAEFEDMFLYDGKLQLKVKYNPKVASFKTTKLEQKYDTIGGKYPFIYRNGATNYKEFPLSGLISYWSDNDWFFSSMEELGLEEENHRRKTEAKEYQIIEAIVDEKSYSPNTYYIKNENNEFESTQHFLAKHNYHSSYDTLSGIMEILAIYNLEPSIYKQISIERSPSDYRRDIQKVKSVDLEDYNVYAERMFKLKVLDWINNGEPKLFRSPAEGNYIVRLLNNSLTPTDTLSRMIHTFNSTAYEIAPFNRANLYAFGFLNLSEPDDKQFQMKTIKLFPKINETTYMLRANEELLKDEIYTLYTNEDVLYKCTKDFEYKKGIFYFLNNENGIYQKDNSDTITEGREYYSSFDDSLTYYTYNTEMGMYVPCLATPREHNNFYYTKDYSTFANSSMWPASYVEFNNVTPGTEVRINNNSYYIGETGTLSVYIKDGIKSVYLPDPRTPNIDPVGVRSGSNLQPILYKNSEVYTERTAISNIPYLKDNASLIAYTGLKKNENDTVNYDKVIIGLKATLIKKYVDSPAYDALMERIDTIIDDLINNLKDKYEKFSNAILAKFSKTYTDVYENILKYIEANEIVNELDESKDTSPINQKERILSEHSTSYREAFSSNDHKAANMTLQVAKANLDLAKNEVTQLENRIESYKENISNLRAANAKNATILEDAEEYNTSGMNNMKRKYITLAKSVKDTISSSIVDTTNLAIKTVKYIGETTDLTYEDLYIKDSSVTKESYISGKYYYYDYSAKSFILDTEEQYQSARYWTGQSQSSTGAMTQAKEEYWVDWINRKNNNTWWIKDGETYKDILQTPKEGLSVEETDKDKKIYRFVLKIEATKESMNKVKLAWKYNDDVGVKELTLKESSDKKSYYYEYVIASNLSESESKTINTSAFKCAVFNPQEIYYQRVANYYYNKKDEALATSISGLYFTYNNEKKEYIPIQSSDLIIGNTYYQLYVPKDELMQNYTSINYGKLLWTEYKDLKTQSNGNSLYYKSNTTGAYSKESDYAAANNVYYIPNANGMPEDTRIWASLIKYCEDILVNWTNIALSYQGIIDDEENLLELNISELPKRQRLYDEELVTYNTTPIVVELNYYLQEIEKLNKEISILKNKLLKAQATRAKASADISLIVKTIKNDSENVKNYFDTAKDSAGSFDILYNELKNEFENAGKLLDDLKNSGINNNNIYNHISSESRAEITQKDIDGIIDKIKGNIKPLDDVYFSKIKELYLKYFNKTHIKHYDDLMKAEDYINISSLNNYSYATQATFIAENVYSDELIEQIENYLNQMNETITTIEEDSKTYAEQSVTKEVEIVNQEFEYNGQETYTVTSEDADVSFVLKNTSTEPLNITATIASGKDYRFDDYEEFNYQIIYNTHESQYRFIKDFNSLQSTINPSLSKTMNIDENYLIDEDGEVHLGYESATKSEFNRYVGFDLEEVPCQEIYGQGSNVDVLTTLKNLKSTPISFNFIEFEKREVGTLYIDKNTNLLSEGYNDWANIYFDYYKNYPVTTINNLDPSRLYELRMIDDSVYQLNSTDEPDNLSSLWVWKEGVADTQRIQGNIGDISLGSWRFGGYYIDKQLDKFFLLNNNKYYLDVSESSELNLRVKDDNMFCASIAGDNVINLEEELIYKIENFSSEDIEHLWIGPGVVAHLNYRAMSIEYSNEIEGSPEKVLYDAAYKEYYEKVTKYEELYEYVYNALKTPGYATKIIEKLKNTFGNIECPTIESYQTDESRILTLTQGVCTKIDKTSLTTWPSNTYEYQTKTAYLLDGEKVNYNSEIYIVYWKDLQGNVQKGVMYKDYHLALKEDLTFLLMKTVGEDMGILMTDGNGRISLDEDVDWISDREMKDVKEKYDNYINKLNENYEKYREDRALE